MRSMRLSDIARVTGGALRGPDVPVSRVVVHSSRAGAGAVFVALRGHRTDGHRFVAEAHRRGATAALVERDLGWDCSLAVVSCTGDALLALAAFEREELGPTVVAVTGSTGKTTTKDMSARILRTNFVTHASPASFNNQVGVPLTILGAMVGTEVLVCEVGAGVVGEIASLCRVARPRIGVVTNVGLAHVETFGSPQNVARAKAELPESLPRNGVAVLNADDPIVASYAGRTP